MKHPIQKTLRLAGSAAIVAIVSASARDASATWENLGGTFDFQMLPGVTYDGLGPGSDAVDVYAVQSSDSSVWLNSYRNSVWQGWTSLGGFATSRPSAVSWSNPVLYRHPRSFHREVFVTSSGTLYHQYTDSEGGSGGTLPVWSGWASLGRPSDTALCGNPIAVSEEPGAIDVFALGCDGTLRHTWVNPTRTCVWCAWDEPSPNLTSAGPDPAVISLGPGLVDVLVQGRSGPIMDVKWNGTGWSTVYTGLSAFSGGYSISTLQITSDSMKVFAPTSGTSIGSALYDPALLFNGSWEYCCTENNVPFNKYFPAVWGVNSEIELFVLGDDSLIHSYLFPSGTENSAGLLDGQLASGFRSDPVVVRGSNRIFVFTLDPFGQLWADDGAQ
jgi:hypothetical protein